MVEKLSGKKQHVRFKSFMSDVYLQAGEGLLCRQARQCGRFTSSLQRPQAQQADAGWAEWRCPRNALRFFRATFSAYGIRPGTAPHLVRGMACLKAQYLCTASARPFILCAMNS